MLAGDQEPLRMGWASPGTVQLLLCLHLLIQAALSHWCWAGNSASLYCVGRVGGVAATLSHVGSRDS